jgi:transposase
MARKKLSVRKTREILRHKLALGRSHREVRDALKVSLGSVTSTTSRAEAVGLDWAAVEALSDHELEQRLSGGSQPGEKPKRPEPDCVWIHTERRRVGVTLELLHHEYLEGNPGGYGYTSFCDRYRSWLKKRKLSMRQVHRAGEKIFVDYSGKRPQIVNPSTGEVVDVELFVGVLGASNYTYAEATLSQRAPDWIASHVRMLEFFGGVAELLIPDQLKSAVTRACRYEPGLHRTYQELARHYDTVALPARPRKPKDKAKAEGAVLIAQRWILARIRNQTFLSLRELNARIWELLEGLNDRTMKIYGASRRSLFERLDQPALKPLPPTRFVYAQWKDAKVNLDYHVEFDCHCYSVPHSLVHTEVELRTTASTVEVFRKGKRVASHARSPVKGRHTTIPEHMPKAHRSHLQWTPTRLIHWGGTVGPKTAELVEHILVSRKHPEQGYRTCLGILRLAKAYGEQRLEAASARALAVGARSYRHVNSILKNGLDRVALPERREDQDHVPVDHENVRGADYYE